MGTSDSHHLLGDEPGYARTMLYVGDGKDVPGGFTRDDVIAAIRAHHTIVTNAPFVDMTIGDAMIGDTIVEAAAAASTSTSTSRAPIWAPVNRPRRLLEQQDRLRHADPDAARAPTTQIAVHLSWR